MTAVFTAADARHWALLTRAALAARRTEIDALNVFPVPDGDTGTNLYLTFDAAIDDVVAAHEAAGILGEATLVQECRSLRRAILLSARGNSGVIVSQLVGGLCDTIIERDAEVGDALLLAEAFARGAAAARDCVAHPQEGTILTVADAGAAAAVEAADDGGTVADVCEAAVTAAQEALARTPDQLEALARAGVVDAGGAGCVLMLESFHRVVTGHWSATESGLLAAGPALHRRSEWRQQPAAGVGPGAAGLGDEPDAVPWAPAGALLSLPGHDPLDTAADRLGGGPAYEVMYLLSDATPEAVATLRATLDALGDSLLVVGGPDLWNIHVHVDDPGAAVEAGVKAGRPQRIRIAHFAAQVASREQPVPLAVVACAAGPGIARVLEQAGAVAVASGPGHRASAGQLLDAVHSTGARAVVLLPGDRDTLMAAEVAAQAAIGEGVDVHVVPARTTVQALAALAVLDPARPVHANVVSMTGAAVATRHGAVSVATKEALTWAGVCHPGDVLGIVDGDVAFLGTEVEAATREVLSRLLSAGGELVTLVVGADADPGLSQRVAGALERDRPDVEVVVIDGGQPVYPLLVGVE
ncbi:MAG TPA: DAK2 domain-containing protein [Ornithinibacter sp.]|nr:DAK2 domain-containing protein [Ornithinibacter sp.]